MSSPWFSGHGLAGNARVTLLCLPFAGGGAGAYRDWIAALAPEIDVLPIQLPGREERFIERPFNRIAPLLAALVPVVAPVAAARPYALFGHSMGGLLAYELAVALANRGLPPTRLFISARQAPHIPERTEPIHALPEPEFLERLRALNGTPDYVLDNPDLMAIISPILRADLALAETYVAPHRAPLAVPINVFGGRDDEEVTEEELRAWSIATTAPTELHYFPGDHFFIESRRDEVLACIRERLLAPTQPV